MPVTTAIRVFALLLTIFGAINLVVLALSDHLQSFVPAVLRPAATFAEALALFGVGAVVTLLADIAGKGGKH